MLRRRHIVVKKTAKSSTSVRPTKKRGSSIESSASSGNVKRLRSSTVVPVVQSSVKKQKRSTTIAAETKQDPSIFIKNRKRLSAGRGGILRNRRQDSPQQPIGDQRRRRISPRIGKVPVVSRVPARRSKPSRRGGRRISKKETGNAPGKSKGLSESEISALLDDMDAGSTTATASLESGVDDSIMSPSPSPKKTVSEKTVEGDDKLKIGSGESFEVPSETIEAESCLEVEKKSADPIDKPNETISGVDSRPDSIDDSRKDVDGQENVCAVENNESKETDVSASKISVGDCDDDEGEKTDLIAVEIIEECDGSVKSGCSDEKYEDNCFETADEWSQGSEGSGCRDEDAAQNVESKKSCENEVSVDKTMGEKLLEGVVADLEYLAGEERKKASSDAESVESVVAEIVDEVYDNIEMGEEEDVEVSTSAADAGSDKSKGFADKSTDEGCPVAVCLDEETCEKESLDVLKKKKRNSIENDINAEPPPKKVRSDDGKDDEIKTKYQLSGSDEEDAMDNILCDLAQNEKENEVDSDSDGDIFEAITEIAKEEQQKEEDELMENIIAEMAEEEDKGTQVSQPGDKKTGDEISPGEKNDKEGTKHKFHIEDDDLIDDALTEMAKEEDKNAEISKEIEEVALSAVVQNINLEEEEEKWDKAIDFLEVDGPSEHKSSVLSKDQLNQNCDSEDDVTALLVKSLVNVVNLQFEKEQCSEKIAIMESILSKKDNALAEKSGDGSQTIEKSIDDLTEKGDRKDSQADVQNVDDPKEVTVSFDCKSTSKKQILEDDSSKHPDSLLPNEICIEDDDDDLMIVDEKKDESSKTADITSSHSLPDVPEPIEKNSSSNVSADPVLKPNLFLPMHVLQTVSENSSDSEKSGFGKLKLEENVKEIIKSLSSPRSDHGNSVVSDANAELESNSCHDDNTVGTDSVDSANCETPVEGVDMSAVVKEELEEPANLSSETVMNDIEREREDELICDEQMDISIENDDSELTETNKAEPSETAKTNGDGGGSASVNGHFDAADMIKDAVAKTITDSFSEDDFIALNNEQELEDFLEKTAEGLLKKYKKMHDEGLACVNSITVKHSNSRKTNDSSRSRMKELALKQNITFKQYGYNTKVEKRTVGVNVRIVQPVNAKVQLPQVNQAAPVQNKPPVATMPLKQSLVPVQTQKTSTALSKTLQTNPGTQLVKVTMVSSPTPVTTVSSTSSAQFVDLTDDDLSHRSGVVAVKTQSSTKPTSTQQNVVPVVTSVPPMVQLVPSGQSVRGGLDTIRMIRQQTPILPQGARFTYLVPQAQGGTLPVIPQLAGGGPNSGMQSVRSVTALSGRTPVTAGQNLQTFILAPVSVMNSVAGSSSAVMTKPALTSLPTGALTNVVASSSSTNPVTISTPLAKSGSQVTLTPCFNKHPAPLPDTPRYPHTPGLKLTPPKPSLKMSKAANGGIVLSWNMALTPNHSEISIYQLYAYQENAGPVSPSLWKKVGDIRALPLPMACTLTQFVDGHKYHFTVRAVDVHKRFGPYSDPSSILLINRKTGQSSSNQSKS